MQVLALDISGIPRAWVSLEQAVVYHAKDLVAWTAGSPLSLFRGGYQKSGERSQIETNSIIALKAAGFDLSKHGRVALTNKTLFGRDRNMCAYCGKTFKVNDLSRDHIHPRSKGGENKWMNVVTACIDCNLKKDDRTPEQARMHLLYAPYVPSHYEHLILQNRNILADQMEYLKLGVPKHSRVI